MVQTKDKYGYRNIEYRDSSRERFELHDADYRGYAKGITPPAKTILYPAY